MNSSLAGALPGIRPNCLLHNVAYDAEDAICVVDGDLRYVAFNPAYAALVRRCFGATIEVGDGVGDAMTNDVPVHLAVLTIWRRALEGEVVKGLHQLPGSGTDGHVYSVRLRRATLPDGTAGAAGILRDITETANHWQRVEDLNSELTELTADLAQRDQANTVALRIALATLEQQNRLLVEKDRQLEAALAESEKASAAKSALLSMLGHELFTPISAIVGYADALQAPGATEVPGRVSTFASRIAVAGWHLRDVIEDVLMYVRNVAGRQRVDVVPADLRDLAIQAIQMTEKAAIEKGLVVVPLVTGNPSGVFTDPVKVRQILINLLGNAIKFTDRGRIALRMSVDHARGTVTYHVYDSGPGIPACDLDRIFEPFVQSTGAQTASGTGLGLAIARQLAELLGGRISVESTLGEGSVFTVTLPLRAPEQPVTREAIFAS